MLLVSQVSREHIRYSPFIRGRCSLRMLVTQRLYFIYFDVHISGNTNTVSFEFRHKLILLLCGVGSRTPFHDSR